jgi:hypothetical protein
MSWTRTFVIIFVVSLELVCGVIEFGLELLAFELVCDVIELYWI